MNIFKKKEQKDPNSSSVFSADLPRQGDVLPESLKAHSRFIKRVNCSQCGAPKTLPSTTAYLYCDYCGSLMDYDFRLANANTNAGLTNTVYHRIIATVQVPLSQAQIRGDKDTCRQIYKQVFSQWIAECPMAVSPRAKNDMAFREQMVAYLAESAITKDFDPQQTAIEAKMQMQLATFQRIPTPGGAWMVAGDFWGFAESFKKQIDQVYALMHQLGVDAMDPDHAPDGVAVRMEYSTFCQSWLPHLSPADGERLLKYYGLSAEYDEVKPQQTNHHQCGCCGSDLNTLPGARQVICENCGFSIDVSSQAIPCRKCGALLSFPATANQLVCPYCSTDLHRV